VEDDGVAQYLLKLLQVDFVLFMWGSLMSLVVVMVISVVISVMKSSRQGTLDPRLS